MEPLIVLCPSFDWGFTETLRYLCLNYAHIGIADLMDLARQSCRADNWMLRDEGFASLLDCGEIEPRLWIFNAS